MPNASRVVIKDQDNSYQALGALTGISGFVGTFERGPINDPSEVINNAIQLRKLYGGYIPGNDDLLLAERILNRGGKLRIVNIRHYDTSGSEPVSTAVKAGEETITTTVATVETPLFSIQPKYAGVKYNDLKVELLPASNGQDALGFFNLHVYIPGDSYANELYENLQAPSGRPSATESSYLSKVQAGSLLVEVIYEDLSGITGTNQLVPTAAQILTFTGGLDGGPVTPTDFIGDAALKTGFFALDYYGDMYDFAAPNQTDSSVHIAGASYSQKRGDIEYLAHLDSSLPVSGLISAREAITVNDKYYSVFSGGVKIKDPLTGADKVISEVADIMGIGAYVDDAYQPWFSQANYTRGFIPNSIGVGQNFGTPGSYADLNSLAQRQINMVIASGGLVYLKGNYSGQFGSSKASFRNVVRLLIYVKKTLRPILEKYLEEPADFITFRNLYNEVKPFLQSLEDGRAVHKGGAIWQGDQDATKMSDLQINTPEDLDQGKYLVLLHLNTISSLGEITLAINLNSAGIILEDI